MKFNLRNDNIVEQALSLIIILYALFFLFFGAIFFQNHVLEGWYIFLGKVCFAVARNNQNQSARA